MRIDAIPIGKNPPDDINVIIEVAIGGEPIKYEMNKEAGTLFVDRFLHTPMRYPGNYGFVPHTLSLDGDPIDVLVANTRPIIPGAVINVRPVGVLKMEDDGGGDEKIIAVPMPKLTKRYLNVHELHRPAARSRWSRSSISSSTTKTWSPANGSSCWAGAMPPRRASSSPRRSSVRTKSAGVRSTGGTDRRLPSPGRAGRGQVPPQRPCAARAARSGRWPAPSRRGRYPRC